MISRRLVLTAAPAVLLAPVVSIPKVLGFGRHQRRKFNPEELDEKMASNHDRILKRMLKHKYPTDQFTLGSIIALQSSNWEEAGMLSDMEALTAAKHYQWLAEQQNKLPHFHAVASVIESAGINALLQPIAAFFMDMDNQASIGPENSLLHLAQNPSYPCSPNVPCSQTNLGPLYNGMFPGSQLTKAQQINTVLGVTAFIGVSWSLGLYAMGSVLCSACAIGALVLAAIATTVKLNMPPSP